MSDQELKDLVASLAIAQAKTDEQIEKTSREIRESQAKTDEQMKETDRQLREQLEKTDKKIDKIAKLVGAIGNNQGDVAEEFFYNSLSDKQSLAGITYDFVEHNWRNRVGKIVDEFDIIMVNGQDIALIEVKYKAHQSDLEKLITKKIDNFKTLYPMYANYKIHLALASFNINEELKDMALEKGVIVIQRKGDTIETFV